MIFICRIGKNVLIHTHDEIYSEILMFHYVIFSLQIGWTLYLALVWWLWSNLSGIFIIKSNKACSEREWANSDSLSATSTDSSVTCVIAKTTSSLLQHTYILYSIPTTRFFSSINKSYLRACSLREFGVRQLSFKLSTLEWCSDGEAVSRSEMRVLFFWRESHTDCFKYFSAVSAQSTIKYRMCFRITSGLKFHVREFCNNAATVPISWSKLSLTISSKSWENTDSCWQSWQTSWKMEILTLFLNFKWELF